MGQPITICPLLSPRPWLYQGQIGSDLIVDVAPTSLGRVDKVQLQELYGINQLARVADKHFLIALTTSKTARPISTPITA